MLLRKLIYNSCNPNRAVRDETMQNVQCNNFPTITEQRAWSSFNNRLPPYDAYLLYDHFRNENENENFLIKLLYNTIEEVKHFVGRLQFCLLSDTFVYIVHCVIFIFLHILMV